MPCDDVHSNPDQADLKTQVETILERCGQQYIVSCRERIDDFCTQHFSVKGAWRIHRQALGHDLWKAPANVLWAIPYLATQGLSVMSAKLGRQTAPDALLEMIMADATMANLLMPELQALDALCHQAWAREQLERYLTACAGSRVAAYDFAGSLMALADGAAECRKQFYPVFQQGDVVAVMPARSRGLDGHAPCSSWRIAVWAEKVPRLGMAA